MSNDENDLRARVEQKLLDIGGSTVNGAGTQKYLAELDQLGQLFEYYPLRRERRGTNVNFVAAKLWAKDVEQHNIAVGLALNR